LTCASVGVDPVRRPSAPIHGSGQRRIAYSCRRKIIPVDSKISGRAKVRCYIDSVGRNRYRAGEIHLLPPGSGLSRERGARQQCPGAAPEMSGVSPGIIHTLVETNAANLSAGTRRESHSQFDCGTCTCICSYRRRRARPDRTRARRGLTCE
jgi:hypothetical protein